MFDPLSQDPPHNPEFPASMSGLELTVDGDLLNGVIYHPAGEGSHPLILLLHGWPGHERNLDFAQILRRAGWTVCVFHYRGSWGSSGSYRFANILDDVKAALEFFRDANNSEKFRIDPEKIITVGHSLGGWASLMTAAAGHVKQAAALSPANIGLWGQQMRDDPEYVRPVITNMVEGSLAPLHGVSVGDTLAELDANVNNWDLVQQAPALADKRLLLLGAKRDMIVSVFDHHMPLVEALKSENAHDLTAKMINADHSYSSNRIEVAKILLDWLAEN